MPTLKLQVRRDTAANWVAANPEMLPGEIGFETDTGKVKIGRTSGDLWNDMSYITSVFSGISTNDITGLATLLSYKADTHHYHNIDDLTATGTKNTTTYLRGDGTWSGVSVASAAVSERFGRLVANTTATGSITLDTTVGDFFVLTLTGNVTITASGLTTIPTSFTIRIIQGGSGGYTVTWNSMFKFANNTAPTLGTAVGDVEWFSCEYVSSGRVEIFKADGPFKA